MSDQIDEAIVEEKLDTLVKQNAKDELIRQGAGSTNFRQWLGKECGMKELSKCKKVAPPDNRKKSKKDLDSKGLSGILPVTMIEEIQKNIQYHLQTAKQRRLTHQFFERNMADLKAKDQQADKETLISRDGPRESHVKSDPFLSRYRYTVLHRPEAPTEPKPELKQKDVLKGRDASRHAQIWRRFADRSASASPPPVEGNYFQSLQISIFKIIFGIYYIL